MLNGLNKKYFLCVYIFKAIFQDFKKYKLMRSFYILDYTPKPPTSTPPTQLFVRTWNLFGLLIYFRKVTWNHR
jgi:hypothetical protein